MCNSKPRLTVATTSGAADGVLQDRGWEISGIVWQKQQCTGQGANVGHVGGQSMYGAEHACTGRGGGAQFGNIKKGALRTRNGTKQKRCLYNKVSKRNMSSQQKQLRSSRSRQGGTQASCHCPAIEGVGRRDQANGGLPPPSAAGMPGWQPARLGVIGSGTLLRWACVVWGTAGTPLSAPAAS